MELLIGGTSYYFHYSADSLALSTGFDPDQAADESIHGWYRLLTDAGYDAVFLDDAGLCSHSWQTGEVLALPYTMVASQEVGQAIIRAKAAGAVLLAGYGTGCFQEEGCLCSKVPGSGLSRAFGLEIAATDYLEPPHQAKLPLAEPISAGFHLDIIQTVTAHTATESPDGRPLVTQEGNSWFFLFDLGYVYRHTSHRASLLSWWKALTGLGASEPVDR